MKLNNKGFAISAILYALLILFTLTLVSLVTGLNSRNRILEKSIETIERKYNWDCKYKDDPVDPAPSIENISIIQHRGKYIFKDTNGNECYTYLREGTRIINLDNIEFTTTECNNNKNNLELIGVCY